MLGALVLGFGLSFIGSVPMTGPLALLLIDRIISGQRASAFWIALSGALVEAVIAGVVATFLPILLLHSNLVVGFARGSGALVILVVGVTLLVRPGLLEAIKTERKKHSLFAGFLTTALNPTLVATWTVIVTGLHSGGAIQGGLWTGLAFGAGVGAGVLSWFALLVALSRRVPLQQLTKHRRELGRGIGAVLTLIGVVLLIRATA